MFSLYGIAGRIFYGPLEQLNQVSGLLPARRARGIAQGDERAGAGLEAAQKRIGGESGAAAAAYTRMLHPEVERDPVRHAYQVMGRNILALRPADTVETAWRALEARKVRQAPVLDPARGVVGLVSDRDLLTVLDLTGGTLTGWLDRKVGDVMVTPVVCTGPATDIRRIARVLLDTGLSALPVVDEAAMLIGIVSRGDILRAAIADPPLSLWA